MRILQLCLLIALPTMITAAPIPKDEELILGVWKIEKFETGDDQKPPEDRIKSIRFEFKKDGKMTITRGENDSAECHFKLDTSKKPKEIDITNVAKPEMLAIYELDGDTFRISGSEGRNVTRPTEFKADGKRTFVVTFKRVVEEKK